jgi:hypothetical protein
MLLKYWEKQRLSQINWRQELASLGVGDHPAIEVIGKFLGDKRETVVSVYLFTRFSGEPGSLVVCHDLGRGAISFGANTQWGVWDEGYEVLTVDGTGEKFNFEGKPADEGDEGACSLGNI